MHWNDWCNGSHRRPLVHKLTWDQNHCKQGLQLVFLWCRKTALSRTEQVNHEHNGLSLFQVWSFYRCQHRDQETLLYSLFLFPFKVQVTFYCFSNKLWTPSSLSNLQHLNILRRKKKTGKMDRLLGDSSEDLMLLTLHFFFFFSSSEKRAFSSHRRLFITDYWTWQDTDVSLRL